MAEYDEQMQLDEEQPDEQQLGQQQLGQQQQTLLSTFQQAAARQLGIDLSPEETQKMEQLLTGPSGGSGKLGASPAKLSMSYKGPIHEWFFALENWLHNNNVPQHKQFTTALTFIDPAVLTLVVPNGDLAALEQHAAYYTLQNLKDWVKASTIGGGGNADYSHLTTANTTRIDRSNPDHAAMLQAMKSAFAQLTNKSADAFKIFMVVKNSDPALRSHIITQPSGAPWPDFASFEAHFLAQAALVDRRTTGQPSKPAYHSDANARQRRTERRDFSAGFYHPYSRPSGTGRNGGGRGGGGGGGRGGGRGRGYTGGRGNNGGRGGSGRGNIGGAGPIKCYRCQGFGHYGRDCATPDKKLAAAFQQMPQEMTLAAFRGSSSEPAAPVRPGVVSTVGRVPTSPVPVHPNPFETLSSLRDAELSVDGCELSEPSPVDELQERYYRMLADMPQDWQDAIFGPGRSSYDPFEGEPGSCTEGARPRAPAVLSPVFADRDQELAALDALIAQFKAHDPPASQGEDSGTAPGMPAKRRKRRGLSAASGDSSKARQS
ncbi:hypothetical protein COO60DRAFT_1707536 [Scenedesmus sp. NREL 46B-D3]|nr:hypothetical protein COO60DRAFT_1707536 [Scenedesmus sp. NREL 46B-D3]